jgi:hypothetical protein
VHWLDFNKGILIHNYNFKKTLKVQQFCGREMSLEFKFFPSVSGHRNLAVYHKFLHEFLAFVTRVMCCICFTLWELRVLNY